MATYQDIVDYLNEHYWADFKLVYNNPGYTINNNDDDVDVDLYISIDIFDEYSTNIVIDKGLSKLLANLLDTPVNQRNKPEIEHTVKPATAESVNSANLLTRLTSVDQVIQSINTFLVSARCNSNPIMTIATDIEVDNLNKILKLYDDYDIVITNQSYNSNVFNLLIEPK